MAKNVKRVEYEGAREAAIEIARAWTSAQSCTCDCELARRARRRAAAYLREIEEECGARFTACVGRILREEHGVDPADVLSTWTTARAGGAL